MAAIALIAWMVNPAGAQNPPPPLGPPPVPPQNPQTVEKINLGKVLFWEEQLSVTGTVACGTCHRPSSGGSDPRSAFANAGSTHPGPDGVYANADDIQGSPGVPAHGNGGFYQLSQHFGYAPQVGARKSPSMINAGYSPSLFWDGRAGSSFSDPLSGQLLIPVGGALENQALAPLLDVAEMAPDGAQVGEIAARIASARPLALAVQVPSTLRAWIGGRGYPALFAEVYGSAEITPTRIAMAMASYQRALFSDQAPIDDFFAGQPMALTPQEAQGQQLFGANDCRVCHAGNRFTDDSFRYIGVRPVNDDLGRFNQTGNPPDRGAFKVPGLRNVELRAPFMHNGRFATLEEVVDFYDRGGDFDAPNKDPRIRPRGLNAQQKAALVAFLKRPLTDPRVGPELPPFDRPTLYGESDRVPEILGSGVAGSDALIPQIHAIEPPVYGNANFTVAVSAALGGAQATLVVASTDPGVQSSVPNGDYANLVGTLAGSGAGAGNASMQLELGGDPSLLGEELYGRVYIADPAAANGLSITPAFRIRVFSDGDLLSNSGFE